MPLLLPQMLQVGLVFKQFLTVQEKVGGIGVQMVCIVIKLNVLPLSMVTI